MIKKIFKIIFLMFVLVNLFTKGYSNDDLISDWHFDECYWDGTSGEVIDYSSNHYNATAHNSATTVSDSILCKGGDFTNTNYIKPVNNVPLSVNYTITLWVKFPLSSEGHKIFRQSRRKRYQYYNIADRPSSDDDFIYFRKNVRNEGWEWCVDGDSGDPTCQSFTMNLTGWHQLAFVASGSNTKMYIDTVYKDTINKKPTGSLNLIGASDYQNDYNGQTIGAIIDEFKIFNRELTFNEILQIYDNESSGKNWDGSERTCPLCLPIADYHFDECFWDGTSGEVFDNSSNHYNATAHNSATTVSDSILCKSGDFTNTNYIQPNTQISLPSNYTIAVWVKFPLSSTGHSNFSEGMATYQYYNIADRPGTNDDFIYFKKNIISGSWLWCVDGDSGYPTCQSFTMNLTGWHQLAFVASGSNTKMYIDTVYKDTINKKPTGSLNLIGASDYQNDYDGQTIGNYMDEFKIFPTVLDEDQIKDIYDNESSGKNWDGSDRSCNSCLIDYHMDECGWDGTSGEVIDSGSNGYNGTAQNGANTVKSVNVGGGGICRVGYFDGVNDYIEIPQEAANYLKRTATLSFWIKTSQTGDNTDWRAPGIIGVEQAGGINDIFWGWIDANGHIGVSKGNNSSNSKSITAINDNNWHHIVLTRRASNGEVKIYIDGNLDKAGSTDSGNVTTNFNHIGMIEDTGGTPEYFQGYLDEVKIFNYILSGSEVTDIYNNESAGKNWWDGSDRECNPCEVPVDHYEIEHDGTGLTCQPEKVIIRACSDNATPCTEYSTETSATLNYDSTSQDYTFTGSTIANVTHQTPGTVTLSLSNMNPVATNGYKCYDNVSLSNSCDITFYDSGFIFNIQDDYSCKPQTVTIKAVRKDDTTQKCIPAFQNTTLPIDFSYTYLNPSSGTTAPQINGNNLNSTIDLTFDSNGESTFNFRYPDAGQIGITANYDNSTSGVQSTGSDSAIFKPFGFYVYTTTSNSEADNDSDSSIFKKAGENFNLTAKAVCWESDSESTNATDLDNNTITPNYQESNIQISHSLIAPSGGNNGVISVNSLNFTNGIGSIDNETFSEVGIIKFTVTDSDYLGADITGTSANIGRFTPHHFKITAKTDGILNDGCSGFTYTGQTVSYSLVPKFTIAAENKDSATTQNYKGNFFKLSLTSFDITTPSEDDNQVGKDGSNKVKLTIDDATNTLTSNNDGTATYSFKNDNITYTREDNSMVAPFSPQFSFQINSISDSDGVNCLNLSDNVTVTGNLIRYGRIKVTDNYGPETEDITNSPYYAQYWDGNNWTLSYDDTCTNTEQFCPSNRVEIEKNIQTNSNDGTGYITVKTSGNSETINVCPIGPNWLIDDSCSSPGDTCGKFTFGIYRGRDRIIMWKEIPAD